jgi:adenylate cyclase
LSDKPSIVVLPFVNLSGDPAQEPFSDSLTEELTMAFSQLSRAFVVSRQSAFTYKGKAVKVQDISQDPRVHYVLSGSVRKSDDRMRVCVHLVDAVADGHLWSERYKLTLKDVFTLQDEIVQRILTALRPRFTLILMLSEDGSLPLSDGAKQ